MSHALAHQTLSSRFSAVVEWLLQAKPSEWRDSQTDSIIAPAEAPARDQRYPEWLGFTPDIQKLLR